MWYVLEKDKIKSNIEFLSIFFEEPLRTFSVAQTFTSQNHSIIETQARTSDEMEEDQRQKKF